MYSNYSKLFKTALIFNTLIVFLLFFALTPNFASAQPLIENGCKDGVVPSQRMADRRKASGMVDKIQRRQQIQSSRVVPNRFHRAADVTQPTQIGPIVGQMWIRG